MKPNKLTFISALAASTILLGAGPKGLAAQADSSDDSQSKQKHSKNAQKSEESKEKLKVSEQEADKKINDFNKASKLTGMAVRNKQNEKIGKISEVVIDLDSGKVAYAVLSTGGKLVAVPIQAFTVQKGEKDLLVNLDKKQLDQAPGFAKNDWPELNAAETGKTIGLASSKSSEQSAKSSDQSAKSSDQSSAAGGTGSQPKQTSSGSDSSPAQAGSVTDLQQLTSTTDASSLDGKQVKLSAAKVQQVFGEKLLALSSDNGQQVFVKSDQPLSSFKAGQPVDITGKARKVPTDPNQLGLDQEAAQKLQGQQIYIEATQIAPATAK